VERDTDGRLLGHVRGTVTSGVVLLCSETAGADFPVGATAQHLGGPHVTFRHEVR
jgi:hypothetical protein